ncbi:MAG: S1 RNA-binding domain-containing protein [Bdellovibrionaceae bacterium]|nr:S1 RNA-binding domain-containing protein [Pseudobdellovibrionaceae bacterium]
MDLLTHFIERRTKMSLSQAQKEAIKRIQGQESLEVLHFYAPELKEVPYWQLDLFASLIDEYSKLDAKKQKILVDLEHQKVENPALIESIQKSIDAFELEDLYRPFKRRKKTKATVAREAGLTEFADWVWDVAFGKQEMGPVSLEVKAKDYIKPQLGFVTYDLVLKGAQDIIVERLLKRSEIRQALSERYYAEGVVSVAKTEKFKEGKYSATAQFREKVSELLNSKNYYKFPVVKKAWEEGFFKVLIEAKNGDVLEKIKQDIFNFAAENDCTQFIDQAFQKAIEIHILPSITQEIVEELLKISETEAIKRLKQDYNRILMVPALGPVPVLSFIQNEVSTIEVALVTNQGELVSATQINTQDENSKSVFADVFKDISSKIQLGALAVGLNEHVRTLVGFVEETLKVQGVTIPVAIVDMRGMTAYVGSESAKKEFGVKPKVERSLVSLARRLQDPLKELAKYPPKSLVDVPAYVTDEKLLPELLKVLKFCVASVGVDLNESSEDSLKLVNGLTDEHVTKILGYRQTKGRFVEKAQLSTELGFNDDTLRACTGFVRVALSKSILDKTNLRTFRFAAIKDMAKDLDISLAEPLSEANAEKILSSKYKDIFEASELQDIIKQLKTPGKDPRRVYRFFGFSDKIKTLADVQVGAIYPGLVTRFSSFGAFVDLGIGQDGLVHLSELSAQFVSDPRKAVGIGEWIYVKVIDLNLDKKLLSLSKIKAERNAKTSKDRAGSTRAERSEGQAEGRGRFENKRPYKGDRKDQKQAKGHKGKGPRSGGGKPKTNRDRGDKKPQSPFNNPFAALGDLNLKD